VTETVAIVASGAVGAWIFGGAGLRAFGLVATFSGIVVASQGNAWGMLAFATGVAMWLIGHCHFALRHRFWKSALAQSIVARVPLAPNPAADCRVRT